MKSNNGLLRGVAPLVVLFFLVMTVSVQDVWGAGRPEEESSSRSETSAEHDHGSDHHESEDHNDQLPEIEAVSLGPSDRLKVVASTSILGDVVTNVTGNLAEVTALVPIGQNPHSWTPAPRDIAILDQSDLVFINGYGLEEGLDVSIERDSGAPVIPVSVGVPPLDHEDDAHDEHDHGEVDPHTWVSPRNVLIWVDTIERALATADPANAEAYSRNSQRYREKLMGVDREIRDLFDGIPSERRMIVTDHASLGYFARDYGLTELGSVIPNTTDQAEPSARSMARLVETIREHQVSAIFVGDTASPNLRQLVDAVANETGREIRILTVLIGSLSPKGGPGDTYLGLVRHNAHQIARGLKTSD